jgi:hypothetical protein
MWENLSLFCVKKSPHHPMSGLRDNQDNIQFQNQPAFVEKILTAGEFNIYLLLYYFSV